MTIRNINRAIENTVSNDAQDKHIGCCTQLWMKYQTMLTCSQMNAYAAGSCQPIQCLWREPECSILETRSNTIFMGLRSHRLVVWWLILNQWVSWYLFSPYVAFLAHQRWSMSQRGVLMKAGRGIASHVRAWTQDFRCQKLAPFLLGYPTGRDGYIKWWETSHQMSKHVPIRTKICIDSNKHWLMPHGRTKSHMRCV